MMCVGYDVSPWVEASSFLVVVAQCPWVMLWLVVVAQCPCMHVLVCHIPPPQSSFAQGVLAASQGYRIARQFTTLRLPKGSMQKGQQSKLTVCGLDPLTPLPQIEAMVMAELPGHIDPTNGNVQEMCPM